VVLCAHHHEGETVRISKGWRRAQQESAADTGADHDFVEDRRRRPHDCESVHSLSATATSSTDTVDDNASSVTSFCLPIFPFGTFPTRDLAVCCPSTSKLYGWCYETINPATDPSTKPSIPCTAGKSTSASWFSASATVQRCSTNGSKHVPTDLPTNECSCSRIYLTAEPIEYEFPTTGSTTAADAVSPIGGPLPRPSSSCYCNAPDAKSARWLLHGTPASCA
jgi:hypothetical protein